jgi:hypothetical protein
VFSEKIPNCAALRVARRRFSGEQRKQRAYNCKNLSNVSLIYTNSKCIELFTAKSKGSFLYVYTEKLDFLSLFAGLPLGRDKKHPAQVT